MSTEKDDFNDPALAELLRRWSQAARKSPSLFETPKDLSALHAAMSAVDAEIKAQAPGLLERLKSATESATRSAGNWIAERVEGAERAVAPLLRGARLTLAHEGILRGAVETKFKSGERVAIQINLDRAASVFVAMLTSELELVSVSSQVKQCEAGAVRLGPYRLDQSAGTESFILLLSEAPRTLDELRALVETAAKSARAVPATHEARLESSLSALRGHLGLEVQGLTFVHESE